VVGYAELYKNAFIDGRAMFDFVKEHHDAMFASRREELAEGIERSVRVKAEVVQEDERESGVRALLNFGHTFAHAFERFFGYERIMHGEAVLWGIACACDLGYRIGTIPEESHALYREVLADLPLPRLPSAPDTRRIYEAMFSDKKVREGKLRFVMPLEPGVSAVRDHIEAADVMATLDATLAKPPNLP
jgi:3-dehydroquinate synthase